MIRAVGLYIMIFISTWGAWGASMASQVDDCCLPRLEESSNSHISESKSKVFASLEEHPEDCAARCNDCVICQTQCNQHSVINMTSALLGLEVVQVHQFEFMHSYSDVHLALPEKPPRV